MEACREILVSGIASLNLNVTDEKIDQLLSFIKLIEKWNKAYNLTAIRDREEMARLHILDSLAIVPHIEGKRVIDIGTGAGLPGIPLAICLPEIDFTLLDSNAKKTRFVQQVVLELKLKNVEVLHSRVENYHPEKTYDAVLTRAFAGLSDIVKLTAHLLSKDGVLLAMKGQNLDAELAEIAAKKSVISVSVPGTDVERCLVRIQLPEQAEVS
ncbi:16S rRNA (guanine(527)-N(7))-methyltransferase RsmG [Methylobacter tundripaludum]|jgi:16S rRNA m(7)G-527 methyltransferase (EC 2.1.1.-)|uniref:Ribosomal RNA small subunit methyltransferase G n=1 Tax=Methylobacter tundripaludum (strain ATCC BAA-1195 / DSM 17260 / SV96) TaxID=697282 RepID=G3IQU5_METTV|nr:16S rRNA (guanine(527)-N(7))-methyltransferase RsmG [Methylobacter tundripaludum]EGW23295.1 Ribosomal RNA small subunit methyltransferase G [Methylobacter tundripaludum SV96]MDD4904824.1 16S rRNA (guanine(527)-N(7))-methyltransferase RsmG [Methylobacter tundripaludum]